MTMELRDKARVYAFVRRVDHYLGLPKTAAGLPPLATLVARAHARGDYAALWLVEGLGLRYAQLRMDAGEDCDLRARADALPLASLPMLHAGLGLALALRRLEALDRRPSPAAASDAAAAFLTDCERLCLPSYRGAALESLGLVLRVFHPRATAPILDALGTLDALDPPTAAAWRGLGRGTYFTPRHFLPAFARPFAALSRLGRGHSATSDAARAQACAGLGWAIAMVNVRAPQVCARALVSLDAPDRRAALGGVRAALLIRAETTPGPLADRYCSGLPSALDPEFAASWAETVATPLRPELAALRASGQLGALFHTLPAALLRRRTAGTGSG